MPSSSTSREWSSRPTSGCCHGLGSSPSSGASTKSRNCQSAPSGGMPSRPATSSSSRPEVSLLDLIFPPRCGGCGAYGASWCGRCAGRVPSLPPGTIAGIPLITVGPLEGPLQRAIHVYKYRPRPQLATALAGCLEAAVRKSGIRISMLTFVPLHPGRQRERGFNQAERLARRVGLALELPVLAGLCRVRPTPAQVGLGVAERRANMIGAFCWSATPVSQYELARYYEALGPIRDLVLDDCLTEVMVNGYENIYVERSGKILLTDRKFDDESHLLRVIDFIVSAVGRRIDFRTPTVDARLLDGSRVNAVISPIALDGPMLTIRKFSRDPFQAEDLVNFGTVTNEAVGFLKACVMARANLLISGGTGTGKTTLLNVCSSFIPPDERIVTIEDAAELQLHQEHVCRMESRPPDLNGENKVGIRELVINALRLRPDRIVVGERRAREALDMLQAMTPRPDGPLTTLHANTTRDALFRPEAMVLLAGIDLPMRAIRQQTASAIDLVVQLSRMRDGQRKVTSITEITGMEGDTITMQEIFLYESHGISKEGVMTGVFRPTGIRPHIMDKLFAAGVPIPPELSRVFPDRRANERPSK